MPGRAHRRWESPSMKEYEILKWLTPTKAESLSRIASQQHFSGKFNVVLPRGGKSRNEKRTSYHFQSPQIPELCHSANSDESIVVTIGLPHPPSFPQPKEINPNLFMCYVILNRFEKEWSRICLNKESPRLKDLIDQNQNQPLFSIYLNTLVSPSMQADKPSWSPAENWKDLYSLLRSALIKYHKLGSLKLPLEWDQDGGVVINSERASLSSSSRSWNIAT